MEVIDRKMSAMICVDLARVCFYEFVIPVECVSCVGQTERQSINANQARQVSHCNPLQTERHKTVASAFATQTEAFREAKWFH